MAGERLRSAKACEHCRVTKRRCQPPHPCRACIRHGRECIVRDKARPHRVPRDTATLVVSPSVPARLQHSPEHTGIEGEPHASRNFDIHQILNHAGLSARDPFDIIVHLIRSVAQERYGYELHCNLAEPQPSASSKICTLGSQLRSNRMSSASQLTLPDIQRFLSSQKQSNNTPLDLVDLSELKSMADILFQSIPDGVILNDIDIEGANIPLDQLALLFITIAFDGFTDTREDISIACLELSMAISDDYVGEPTFYLALTLFLQHTCVLRTSTSNRGRALIAQAVQVAHDVGINRGIQTNKPLQAARFYLVLYFTDQYCAMTHNTATCIKPDDYLPELFQPLLEVYPHLHTLVELVVLNGQVLDSLNNHSYTYENIISLESAIGNVCSRIGRPSQGEWHRGERFEFRYTTLVQIHMFWSRILVRAPLILAQEHWLCSLSICLRASQMLLSVYFNILSPAIHILAQAYGVSFGGDWKRQLQEATKLPPTWRQVRRITTSIFIILYAFWHGEVSYDKAGRSCACALLLLEFQRTRWASGLDNVRNSIRSLASVSGIQFRKYLQDLLPHGSESYIDSILDTGQGNSRGHETGSDALGLSMSSNAPLFQEPGLPEAQMLPEWNNGIGDIFDSISLYHDLSTLGNWDFDDLWNTNNKGTEHSL